MSDYNLVPTVENLMAEALNFELPKLDRDDWNKVEGKVKDLDISWSRAVDVVKAEKLIEQSNKPGGVDPLLVIICKWPQLPEYKANPKRIPSLEFLISRLAEIILKGDKSYEFFFDEEHAWEPTILHHAAKQNFLHVSRMLVERWPSLMYQPTKVMIEPEKMPSVLPVEVALENFQDDTAAYLISQMKYDRVQELFLCKESEEKSKLFFGKYISYHNPRTNEYGMKKTVLAVLNKLMDPHWPYLPKREEREDDNMDKIRQALESVPNDPLSYDFYYHILETDENGRVPDNKVFNQKSVSCLRRIADSDNKEAMQHPVVRMLVAKKWNKFAHKLFCIKAAFYLLFFGLLSFALIYGSTRNDPTQYEGSADKFRAICEICSIVFLMAQLFDEIGEMAREGRAYLKVRSNYIDLPGIILTLLVIPLRFAEVKSQWGLAAIGYLFNFLRLFKFSNVARNTGLYTTTLVKIIEEDITRFLVFFSAIFIGFCGAMFLALKVNDVQDSYSFPWVMLGGIKVLVEGETLEEEDGKEFGWFAVAILLVYMGIVMVILLNVLIAQLSYTFGKARKMARLQFAADNMRIITRTENSRFPCLNFRVKKYDEGAYICDEDLAKEILEFTEDRHPWETAEERIIGVRETMRRVVKGEETDPWETIDEKLTTLTLSEKETRESIYKKLTAILRRLPESRRYTW